MPSKTKSDGLVRVDIKAPEFRVLPLRIRGTSIYVSNNFSQEARDQLAADMAGGSVDKKRGGKGKKPKDFQAGFEGSLHVSTDGWHGIPCTALRSAMVRAAQLCGVEMTKAKMCVFVLPDGTDKNGQGLVRITGQQAERFDAYVRNANGGADIRARARFAAGWEAIVKVQYDADFMSANSVANLLARAGVSVGIGAGRAFSSMSVGQGWGGFELLALEATEGQEAA